MTRGSEQTGTLQQRVSSNTVRTPVLQMPREKKLLPKSDPTGMCERRNVSCWSEAGLFFWGREIYYLLLNQAFTLWCEQGSR